MAIREVRLLSGYLWSRKRGLGISLVIIERGLTKGSGIVHYALFFLQNLENWPLEKGTYLDSRILWSSDVVVQKWSFQ